MSNLILLVAAAFMVVTGIYLGQQGLALARANKALRKVIASMDRVEALEAALRTAADTMFAHHIGNWEECEALLGDSNGK